IGRVEAFERNLHLLGVDFRVLAEDAHHQWSDCLVKLEDDVTDKTVANDHIEGTTIAGASGKITAFDVAVEVESSLLKEHVRLLHHRVALLRLLADREEPDRRIGAAEDALSVNCANPRELEQLPAGAVDVGTGVDDDDRI